MNVIKFIQCTNAIKVFCYYQIMSIKKLFITTKNIYNILPKINVKNIIKHEKTYS